MINTPQKYRFSKFKAQKITPLITIVCKYANIGEIHYHKGKQNKWSKQIEFSAESNQFEKKSKVGMNETYSNC